METPNNNRDAIPSSFLHASRHYPTLMAAEESRRAEADRLRASTGTAAHRLAAFFIEMTRPEHQPFIGRQDGSMIVMVFRSLTQQDLATWSGMSLRSVQRGLAELEGQGIVSFSARGAVILDHDGLRRAAGIELFPVATKAVLNTRTPVPI